MQVNEFTAELCGIILGDGNMHKTHNRITICGSTDDLLYFQQRVIPLFKKCFSYVNPRIVVLKGRNAYNLEIENVGIFRFFIDAFGLQRGPKDTAHVPAIIASSPALIPHFLRGLFDTDGCFKFCKQTKSYSYYPRIRFALVDSPLIHELHALIAQAGFAARKYVRLNHGYKQAKDLVTYEISGSSALERWMRIIRPANPVHVVKYAYWKEFGHHLPHL